MEEQARNNSPFSSENSSRDYLMISSALIKLNILKYLSSYIAMKQAAYLRMILLLTTIIFETNASNMYTFHRLSTERGARCLDGSPMGYYIHNGTGANQRKMMISMDSGAFCSGFTLEQTLEACYKRSFTGLGSTKNYPPQKSFDTKGVLSTIPDRNPNFYDWTKIYVVYCDGSEYTGTRPEPVSYKDTQLYFRGYDNVMELFRTFDEEYDFYNWDSIVLQGVSAGGMGTFFYSNYLMENTQKAKVYAIPDSGLFMVDFFSTVAGAQIMRLAASPLMQLVNVNNSGFPISACFDENKENILECYTTSNLTKWLKAPMLIIESPYDSYSIENIVYTDCLRNQNPPYSLSNCNTATRSAIEQYRSFVIEALYKLKNNRKDVGVWGPSCAQHGFSCGDALNDTNYRVPSGTGKLLYEVINDFLEDPDNAPWYLDEEQWPANEGCKGKSSYRFNLKSQ